MSRYWVHLPETAGADPAAARFVADGWSWPGFIFGPFWLAWHRQWLGLALYVAVWLAIAVAGQMLGMPRLALSALTTLLNVIVALEGGHWRSWRLHRAGVPVVDIVNAASRSEAELRYFGNVGAAQTTPAVRHSGSAETTASPHWQPRASGIIGLFPNEGGR